jgi:hypothetical protein
MNLNIPDEILQALEIIETLLQETHVDWLVGGSTGLLMQGVPIFQPPRDLDIYVDASDAALVYDTLQLYAMDQLIQSQTDIYDSALSHFQMGKVQVEVVGGFKVRVGHSQYKVEVCDLLMDYKVLYGVTGKRIGLMPLAHEFIFNLLRQRPDRYLAIAEKMRSNPAVYLVPLNKIIERNIWAPDLINQINELVY